MLIGARNGILAGGKRLPYKKRVQYIATTGVLGQYIITNLICNNLNEISITCMLNESPTYLRIFGDTTGIQTLFTPSESFVSCQFSFRSDLMRKIPYGRFDYMAEYKFRRETNSIKFYIDGVEKIQVNVQNNSSPGYLMFGSMSSATKTLFAGASAKSNDNLVMELIPVIDLNDEPKMFDLVTQTYPAHYGTFQAGPDL